MIKKPLVIAEIGCNHKGDFNIAKELILAAKNSGATYAKFQKRDNKYLLGKNYFEPHPNPVYSYGKNYGLHRDKLEFNIKQHYNLYKFCKKIKIGYATSVWEVNSAREFLKSKIVLDYIKIPSACNLDQELLIYLFKNFKKPIHISLGMTSKNEINKIYRLSKKYKASSRLVFYACTSDYPVTTENLCLLEIDLLIKKYGKTIKDIAFSGHHLGIASDIAAFTLGAHIIERHFTLDRTWKGTDHAASLEPNGFAKLVRDLNNVYKALKYKKDDVLRCEKASRKKLKLKKF